VTVCAVDSADLAGRYSVGDLPAVQSEPAFTLLEPAWLLPPVAALDTAAALDSAIEGALHEPAAAEARGRPVGGPLSYSLTDALSAQVRYRRSLLFETQQSAALRVEGPRSFSSRPVRDVLGLNMSWRLAGSTLGLGYQLESASEHDRGADAGVNRFLPGSEQATHSLTLGVSREWGRAEPPIVDGPLAAEVAEAPVTPAPDAK
jgi:hypothetical protein